tara:strand:+ start:542 stop:721 length:180 start_codon:yes stop_codon:yes gene_type:complete
VAPVVVDEEMDLRGWLSLVQNIQVVVVVVVVISEVGVYMTLLERLVAPASSSSSKPVTS